MSQKQGSKLPASSSSCKEEANAVPIYGVNFDLREGVDKVLENIKAAREHICKESIEIGDQTIYVLPSERNKYMDFRFITYNASILVRVELYSFYTWGYKTETYLGQTINQWFEFGEKENNSKGKGKVKAETVRKIPGSDLLGFLETYGAFGRWNVTFSSQLFQKAIDVLANPATNNFDKKESLFRITVTFNEGFRNNDVLDFHFTCLEEEKKLPEKLKAHIQNWDSLGAMVENIKKGKSFSNNYPETGIESNDVLAKTLAVIKVPKDGKGRKEVQ